MSLEAPVFHPMFRLRGGEGVDRKKEVDHVRAAHRVYSSGQW